METINFHYTPNVRDYINAMWEQLRRNVSMLATLALSALGVLFILVYIAQFIMQGGSLFDLSQIPGLITVLLLLTMPWLIFFVVMPLVLRSQVNRNERLRCESFVQADIRGLVIRNRFSELKTDWGTFGNVIETRDYFFLPNSVNSQMVHIFPKRAFDSSVSQSAFRELLLAKVRSGEIKPGPSARSARLSRWIVPIIVVLLVIAYAVVSFIRVSSY